MQHVLVCAQDSVLAKKVRFLLANDQCDVEILDQSTGLDSRLEQAGVDLLVLSRQFEAQDAVEWLGRVNPSVTIPPTLVLGGDQAVTADFIHLIPDPIDTQAIYRIASDILDGQGQDDTTDEETLMSIEAPRNDAGSLEHDKTAKLGLPTAPAEEELSYSDVTGLDEIAGRLDQLESDQLNDQLSDAFDIDEASEVATPQRRPAPKNEPPVTGGTLEPASLAKVLHQCGAKEVNGALIVIRDEETSTIYLERGAPVHIESSIPGDQLGRALVERGRVTDAQYADGAKRAIERGLSLGAALVELGFFTNEELGVELGNTARDRIVACFAARSGAFEFDGTRGPPSKDRPYRIEIPHIIAEGLRTHADEAVLDGIMGEADERYFKTDKTIPELAEIYPLGGKDKDFLAFSGRAYNVMDAAESSGLSREDAYKLLSLLTTCEDLSDFTPGMKEFEDRIKEEQKRVKELQSTLPAPASSPPAPAASLPPIPSIPTPAPAPAPAPLSTPSAPPLPEPAAASSIPSDAEATIAGPPSGMPPPMPAAGAPWGDAAAEAAPPPPPPPPPPSNASQAPVAPPPSTPPAAAEDIPPMPVPGAGDAGMTPRPLVYAKPLPRGPDGSVLETSERTLSREHFQRGVTLLGQGNFANAEEAFRDAVALCAEEHVYLIGLARAIYYNPGYGAAGKVPVLRDIVGRASALAPEDKRVATLASWVDAAHRQI